MTVDEVASRLKCTAVYVRKLCREKKLIAEKKEVRPGHKDWIISAESALAMEHEKSGDTQQKEIADHQREERRAAEDIDLNEIALDLGLNSEQRKRLFASSKIPKKKAEAILKAEQAFERQSKNLLQSKNLVSLEDLQEGHDRIFSVQFRNLQDLIESFVTKFRLTPAQAAEARTDFDNVMRRTRDELLSIASR